MCSGKLSILYWPKGFAFRAKKQKSKTELGTESGYVWSGVYANLERWKPGGNFEPNSNSLVENRDSDAQASNDDDVAREEKLTRRIGRRRQDQNYMWEFYLLASFNEGFEKNILPQFGIHQGEIYMRTYLNVNWICPTRFYR